MTVFFVICEFLCVRNGAGKSSRLLSLCHLNLRCHFLSENCFFLDWVFWSPSRRASIVDMQFGVEMLGSAVVGHDFFWRQGKDVLIPCDPIGLQIICLEKSIFMVDVYTFEEYDFVMTHYESKSLWFSHTVFRFGRTIIFFCFTTLTKWIEDVLYMCALWDLAHP